MNARQARSRLASVVLSAVVAGTLVLGVAGSQSWQARRVTVGVDTTSRHGGDLREATPTGTVLASSPYDAGVRLAARQPTQPDSVPLLRAVETVTVDPASSGQQWTGVGAALTDASVTHLDGRPDLIRLLFDPASERGARLQWLRLPLSATDFSSRTWGWRVRDGRVVPSPEALRTLRFLRDQVLSVNPALRIVASPWSAPPRFKDRPTWFGGHLRDDAVRSYAALLVGQVRWLRRHDFPVRALTLANEPGLASDYPTMLVSDGQLRRLALRVGPQVGRLGVDLWALDHNWSDTTRAATALRNAPGTYDAVAFHCYEGIPSQAADLGVPWIMDECTGTDDSAVGTVTWDSRVLIDQSIAAGSTGLLMWNLALSPGERGAFGGCGTCRGLMTVDGDRHYAEPEYYVLAHLSRAARGGSTVLDVSSPPDVVSVGFRRPDGSVGVYGYNGSDRDRYLRLEVSGTEGQVFRIGPREVFTWSS